MNKKSISVIISTKNRKSELKRAVNSVLKQTTLPSELIIIDDGSDIPIDIIDFENNVHLPLVTVRNQVSVGAASARNIGVQYAKSTWVSFLDDDDEFMSTKIEHLLSKLNDDVDFIFHAALIHMVNENASYSTKNKTDLKFLSIAGMMQKNDIGGTPMVVMRKSLFHSLGGFDSTLSALEDFELWIRVIEKGARLEYIDFELTKCNYTTGLKSVSKSIENYRSAFDKIYIKNIHSFATMSPAMIRKYSLRRILDEMHINLLNYNFFNAFLKGFEGFFRFGSLTAIAIGLAALVLRGKIFTVRSYFKI